MDQPTLIMPVIAVPRAPDEPPAGPTLRNGRAHADDAPRGPRAGPPQPVGTVPVAAQLDHFYQTQNALQEQATGGWRRAVQSASAGLINVGESRRERLRRLLTERATIPIRGDFRVAVLSLKGGVGKTTTTAALGATLAALRGDRVIAVDASPEIGTLAHRGPNSTLSSARTLLRDKLINRYSDVREHTSQTKSRLEILASEQNPANTQPLSGEQYSELMQELSRYYNVILTDCGTGLVHSTMPDVLNWAHAVVTVTAPTADAVHSANVTLEWLHRHGYAHLAATAVVVVCAAQRQAPPAEVDRVVQHFQRFATAHYIPFDEHLATGTELDLAQLNVATRDAFLELAASVADRSRGR
jgi:MinD-like ATPase involved in chromosome partitioning or flagellar assembly